MKNLTKKQMERYNRNILLNGIGLKGQMRLRYAKVLVIGAGGLGSSTAFYLCAAGVGILGLADSDKVELSNLQRQILHSTSDIGSFKTESGSKKLKALNPDVKLRLYPYRLTPDKISDVIIKYDFVVDCTDNFETKFLINDTCVMLGKPFSHCGVSALKGQAMTYVKGNACYRCVFGAEPQKGEVKSTAEVGILGSVPGLFGCLQATEAIKYLTGAGELLLNRVLVFNMLDMKMRTVNVLKNPCCPVCAL